MSEAFLSVEHSALGRRWEGPAPEIARLGQAIAQSADLPEIIGRILARRGVLPAEAAAHLAPSMRDLMPDPSCLRDMDAAAERFLRALRAGERIAVFADYDVDGGASAALLMIWLREMGAPAPTLYIPDRLSEGYGPNVPAMRRLGAAHDLILCVDCGTIAIEPIAAAGCDVLVLDHHQSGETLPPALAVVNPNRQDEDAGLGYLCGAGVVFLMLVAANRSLRKAGSDAPDLMAMLDLVALATVADVAPLTGLNRAFVRQGLAMMAQTARPGLAALGDVAGLTGPPSVYSLGFAFGPRINAGGRVGAADLGAKLLATEDPAEAEALAKRLEALNLARRDIEAGVLVAAMAQCETRDTGGPLVWAAGEGWHPGVVGIVAARLKEAFHRPAVVIGLNGAQGQGSGRSISGVDLGAAVARLMHERLITRGGGHAMAAGLSLKSCKLEEAMARLGALLAVGVSVNGARPPLRIDGVLAPGSCDPILADQIAAAGPFGAGAPAPRVALAAVRVLQARRVGENHLALRLDEGSGTQVVEAMAFRASDGALGEMLAMAAGGRVHVAGRLERDDWGGRRRAKLHIEDAAPVA